MTEAFRGGREGASWLTFVTRNRILNKTLDYLDAFARFKQKENVEAVERLLSARKDLTKFERGLIGALGNSLLCFPMKPPPPEEPC